MPGKNSPAKAAPRNTRNINNSHTYARNAASQNPRARVIEMAPEFKGEAKGRRDTRDSQYAGTSCSKRTVRDRATG